MSHDEFPLGASRHKAPRGAQHRLEVIEKKESRAA
jgi:hypothetical protein